MKEFCVDFPDFFNILSIFVDLNNKFCSKTTENTIFTKKAE